MTMHPDHLQLEAWYIYREGRHTRLLMHTGMTGDFKYLFDMYTGKTPDSKGDFVRSVTLDMGSISLLSPVE